MTVDFNFMVGGEAGQGVQSVGSILSKTIARGGLYVFADQDYESRVRGGHNFFRIRVSDEKVLSIAEELDVLIALNEETIQLHRSEVKADGAIIYDGEQIKLEAQNKRYLSVPLARLAEEMAKSFTDDPIYVSGLGQGSGRGFHASDALTYFEATRYAAQEAYGMSGLTPQDIQFSEVHDCFSIAELVHIEDLGFFKPGEGYKAVAEGATRLDGTKPINTSGGLKCKGHPVGATGISQLYEVWTQLRGQAGPRQVPVSDLRIGGAHNLGGTGGTCTFTILERR